MYFNRIVPLLFSATLAFSSPSKAAETTENSWSISDVTKCAQEYVKPFTFIISPFVLNYVYLRFLKNPARRSLEPTANNAARLASAIDAVTKAYPKLKNRDAVVKLALESANKASAVKLSLGRWLGGMGFMFGADWFVGLASQALSKPVANIADETNKKINGLIAKQFDDVATTDSKGKIADANAAFMSLSARMDTNHDIAAQLGRANHSRMLLYVSGNIDKAVLELSQGRPVVARFLLADAAVYLRQAFAEVDPADAVVAAGAKHAFKNVKVPAHFGVEVMAATLLHDGDGAQEGVRNYYNTLFSSWGLVDQLDVPCAADPMLSGIEDALAKQSTEPKTQWLESVKALVQYSSGFFAFEILSLFQASSMGSYDMGGQVKSAEFITGIKNPLVNAMQDNLNKVTLGHLQKLMMNGKNSHLVQRDAVISETSRRQSSYYVRCSQSYTLNAVNARSNFSRAFAIVANKIHNARDAMFEGNEELASSMIAAGMHYQRLTHNELLPDDYFFTNMARTLFSMHFKTSKAFRERILEKALERDESYLNDKTLKDEILGHYTAQLDAWQVGTQE